MGGNSGPKLADMGADWLGHSPGYCQPPESSPYDWSGEVEPVCFGNGQGNDPYTSNRGTSHGMMDRWGHKVLFTDAGGYGGIAVYDYENTSWDWLHSSGSYSYAYHWSWDAWSDYIVGNQYSTNTGPIRMVKYNDEPSGYTVIVYAHHYNTGCSPYTTCPRPEQSPDGTKAYFHTNYLSNTDDADIYYVVAYFPYPPEITQVTATGGLATVRFDWRLDQANPRSYTDRGWPNESTNDSPPPRETEKFRLWRSSDNVNWVPISTINTNIFEKYDFIAGTWESGENSYWEITDTPGDGTWYYAVTSVEFSGLESRTLSNRYSITISGGSGTGSQSNGYPSSPGDLDDISDGCLFS